MKIDLRPLHHLRVLAELGNFSRAAESLHITQSALSRSIQALEGTVGAPLVVRQRGGVEPTDLGRVVLRHARTLDTASRDLERDIRLAKGLDLGELRIGAGPFGGSALIGPVVGRLHHLHPGLRIRVVIAPWQELPRRARERDVDVVVLEVSEVEALDDFETLALQPHRLDLVCRVGHPITRFRSPAAPEVLRYPLAGPRLTAQAHQLLANLNSGPPRDAPRREGPLAIECDSSSLLKSILAQSDALSMMPRFMIEAELASRQLTHLPGTNLGLGARFGAAWLRQRSLSGAGQKFIELLQAHDAALAQRAAAELAGHAGRRGRRSPSGPGPARAKGATPAATRVARASSRK